MAKELDFDYEPDEANRVWPDGTYSASIITVQKKTSRAGNSMLEICLEVYLGTKKKLLWDYIVRPTTIWKLEELAKALGAIKAFKEKTFDLKEYVGKSLEISIRTKDDAEFGKHNVVAKYISSKEVDREVPF